MKLAVIGSRSLPDPDLSRYIPSYTKEIVSGGAKGIDTYARNFALRNDLRLTEFTPDYARYKRGAPLIRNKDIASYADKALIFWDGSSRGTADVIKLCEALRKPYTLYRYDVETHVYVRAFL